MGIFYEQIEIVNRAPVALNVRFDGQDMILTPGSNFIPKVALQYAMNQNPIMGSQSPEDPSIMGAQFLIGVPSDKTYPCESLTTEEWEAHLGRPCRIDEQALFAERYGNDPKARMVVHGKRGRDTNAHSRTDAGIGPQGISSFESDRP